MLETERSIEDSLADYDNGVLEAAAPILARQESDRIIRHFEHLAESGEPDVRDYVGRETNLGLLVAMFVVGREAADGGVEVCAERAAFGDHPNGLSEIRIEVAARRGDFEIELIMRWDEFGPNPAHYEGGDESAEPSLSKQYELAVIRDQSVRQSRACPIGGRGDSVSKASD